MLKKYFLSLCFIVPALSFGQQVEFRLQDDPFGVWNGDTITVLSDEASIHVDFYLVNTTAFSDGFKWRRTILSASSGTFTDQLCDDQLCFDCVGNPWTRPANITIAAGDSSLFQPKLISGGISGTAHHRYYAINSLGVILDSVDVIFTTTVAVPEEAKIDYKAYPNPANETFTISMNTTSQNVQVAVYNLLGSEVARKTLVNGTNTVAVDAFENGIYFYSVIMDGEVIETKKLIIRH